MAVVALGLAVMPALAQNDAAQAVIDRYEKVTGQDKLTPADMASVWMVVDAEVQGMAMPMKMIVKAPNKLWVDMQVAGQKMLMVSDGDKGWVSIPGQGVQPMPKEMLVQIREQTNISQNYRWNRTDYDYKMAGEVKAGGVTYQGIQMLPKKPLPQMTNMVVYFDKATGLVSFITMDVDQNGTTTSARVDATDYKTFGNLKLPTVYTVGVGGAQMMKMTIKELQYAYPVSDATFAKPE